MNNYKEYDEIFDGWSSNELFVANDIINEGSPIETFSRKELNTANQMKRFLEKKEISLESFNSYIESIRKSAEELAKVAEQAYNLRREAWLKIAQRCPDCGEAMNVFPVNINNSTMIEDKTIKSTWMCPNEKECGYQSYDENPAEEYLSEIYDI